MRTFDVRILLPGVALLAMTLALAACGSGSDATSEVLAATAVPRTPTATPTPTSPLLDGEATRWGYHPGRETGEDDPPPTLARLPNSYRIEAVVSGLERPTALAFTPDGRLLVTEQGGAVRVVQDGTLRAEPYYTAAVYLPAKGSEPTELGLVGIAVHPDYGQNGYVYLYYTADVPERRTVLVRVRERPDGTVGDVKEILSVDAAPACCHIAGGLAFAADGMLFVSVGDHQMEAEPQNSASPLGSILRIDPDDGSAPPDNPFVGDEAFDARIYAYGLRNPFGVTIDPLTGAIYATENGFRGQDAVIEVRAGANYGWPGYDLDVPVADVEPPLLFYHNTIGPSGIDFYRGDVLPELDGTLLFCQFHQSGALHVVRFNADGSVAEDGRVIPGCTSGVRVGPDGFVYYIDYGDGVVYRLATR